MRWCTPLRARTRPDSIAFVARLRSIGAAEQRSKTMHIEPGVLAAGKIRVANAVALGVVAGAPSLAARGAQVPFIEPTDRLHLSVNTLSLVLPLLAIALLLLVARVAGRPGTRLWFETRHAQGMA
jgi:hypothetical protein